MKTGMLLFITGLVMLMLGIYLSTHWVSVGTLIGISGGLMLGVSTCFLGAKKQVPKSK